MVQVNNPVKNRKDWKKYLLHHFIIISGSFGISFNGYEVMDLNNKIDYIRNILRINLNDRNTKS